jgi:FkbH-like protein
MKNDFQEQIAAIKCLIKEKKFGEAFAYLSQIADPMDDLARQHRYVKLFNAMTSSELGLQPIKIGMVSTSSVEHLVDIFRFWLAKDGFDADIFLADFDTMDQTVLDPASALYSFKPDFIWLFSNHRDIPVDLPYGCPANVVDELVQAAVQRFVNLWKAVQAKSSAYIIQNNADLPLVRVFGNYEGTTHWGQTNVLRKFNLAIAQAARSGVTIFDLDYLSSFYGKRFWFDERYWYHSKHAFTLDANGFIAFRMARLIKGFKGQARKCIVLDLDNTIWGGVIGDDGVEGIKLGNEADGEAFVDFQKYLRKLKNRGVILTVCSKNQEENARLPFESHPEMHLHLDDIAVFTANWNNKSDNIRSIAEVLDIGLDSLVFIDDNTAERELVRSTLPMVAVPEMPEDPVRYVRTLDQCCYFEAITFSQEDSERNDMYRSNAERRGLQKQYSDVSDFLESLEMKAFVGEFDEMNLPRIAQLINKSNQFHLTTTRYSEAQIKAMMKDDKTICRYFKLKDRFGDNGLISIIILKKINGEALLVDTWVMSCRVLARGMEEFVQNEMLAIGRGLNAQRIIGKYIPTKKNRLVEELYKRLDYDLVGRESDATVWTCSIDGGSYVRKTLIERVDNY